MPGLRDPTRSQGLRRSGRAVVNRRVFELHRALRTTLQENDLVGLRKREPLPREFLAFVELSSNRVDRSENMVRRIVEGILDSQWLHELIDRAIWRGLEQVAQELKVAVDHLDAREVSRLHAVAAGLEVDGIANETIRRAMRNVVEAIELEWNPELLMREMRTVLEKITRRRLVLLVNTAVVRAVNGGKLFGYEMHGIKQVGIDPEWMPHVHTRDGITLLDRSLKSTVRKRKKANKKRRAAKLTAGQQRKREAAERALEQRLKGKVEVLTAEDDKVCIQCEDISADGPYDLNTARSLIPAHPNCRCAFIPASDRRFAPIEREE